MEGGSSSLNKPATLNETHPIERQQQQLNTMAPKSGNRKKQFLIAPSDLKFSNDQQLQILNSTNEPKSFLAHGGFGLVQKATLNGVEVTKLPREVKQYFIPPPPPSV